MHLHTATTAARLAGRILMDNLFNLQRKQASSKSQFDFVTEVDVMAEQAILAYIHERHPRHRILAEESGGEQGFEQEDGFLWIIDPLDGTANYIHGFPFFSVSVALMQGGDLVTGVIYDPLRDEMFHAEKGGGAFLNGTKISVSNSRETDKCLLATGFPFRAKHLSSQYFAALSALFQTTSDFRRAGSAALDLANVACGRVDGFWEVTLKSWDIAAGILLVNEAGGRCSDIWGGDTHLHSGHIAASNGTIHKHITDTVGPFFADIPNSEPC